VQSDAIVSVWKLLENGGASQDRNVSERVREQRHKARSGGLEASDRPGSNGRLSLLVYKPDPGSDHADVRAMDKRSQLRLDSVRSRGGIGVHTGYEFTASSIHPTIQGENEPGVGLIPEDANATIP
jgi:hypothetical protein